MCRDLATGSGTRPIEIGRHHFTPAIGCFEKNMYNCHPTANLQIHDRKASETKMMGCQITAWQWAVSKNGTGFLLCWVEPGIYQLLIGAMNRWVLFSPINCSVLHGMGVSPCCCSVSKRKVLILDAKTPT